MYKFSRLFVLLTLIAVPVMLYADSGESTRIVGAKQHAQADNGRNQYRQKSEYVLKELDLKSGDVVVDIADSGSIKKMFEEIGSVDAIVAIAGEAKWAEFESMNEDDFYIGLKSKLIGQVNLVRIGQSYLNTGGSFTLTTGILADQADHIFV